MASNNNELPATDSQPEPVAPELAESAEHDRDWVLGEVAGFFGSFDASDRETALQVAALLCPSLLLGDDRGAAVLENLATSRSSNTRALAVHPTVRMLGLDQHWAFPVFEHLISDPDPVVQTEVDWALEGWAQFLCDDGANIPDQDRFAEPAASLIQQFIERLAVSRDGATRERVRRFLVTADARDSSVHDWAQHVDHLMQT